MRGLAIVHQADAGPGVFAEVLRARGWQLETWEPPTQPPPGDAADYDAVLPFGGAAHPDEDDRHGWLATEKALLADLVGRGVPTLAVCLGAELLAEAAGGSARRAAEPEIGWRRVEVTPDGARDPLLGPLAPAFDGFQWHSYTSTLPPGATALARGEAGLAAYRVGDHAWGIQFHAEVTLEDIGKWIRDYRTDPDAVRVGLDPDALAVETEARISAWNALGAGICERFLTTAATRA